MKNLIAVLMTVTSLSINAQENNNSDFEFLYAIVEVENKKDGSIGIDILNSKVIAHPLKTQSESNKGNAKKSNDISVLIKDRNGIVLDEIVYDDVFKTDLEYVNENGEYQHYERVVKKKVILIRKVIDKTATSLSFIQGGNQKSQSIHNFNFR